VESGFGERQAEKKSKSLPAAKDVTRETMSKSAQKLLRAFLTI
jgi:hypothetical protein